MFALSLSLKNEIRFLLCISFPSSSSCGLACVSCEGLTIASCVKTLTLTPPISLAALLVNSRILPSKMLSFFLGYNDCSRGASNANWNHQRRKTTERYAWLRIMTHTCRHGWHRQQVLDKLQILLYIPHVARRIISRSISIKIGRSCSRGIQNSNVCCKLLSLAFY